jgi:hypothetical protein
MELLGSEKKSEVASPPPPPPPHHHHLPAMLGGVCLDYGWHGGDDGLGSKMGLGVREFISFLIWGHYLWRHRHVHRSHGLDTDPGEMPDGEEEEAAAAADPAAAPPNLLSFARTSQEACSKECPRSVWSSLRQGTLSLHMFRRAREASLSFTQLSRSTSLPSRYYRWMEHCQPQLDKVGAPLLLVNSYDDPVLVWDNAEPHFLAQCDANPFVARWELARGGHGTKSTGLMGFFPSWDLAPRAICEFLEALLHDKEKEEEAPWRGAAVGGPGISK